MLFCGLDVGTTGVKAAIFNEKGETLGYAFEEYGVLTGENNTAEQDAEEVWEKACLVLQKAAHGIGDEVEALSLSVQGDAVIPVDCDGNALSHAHLGMDYRAVEEVQQANEAFSERGLFDVTGMRPHPMNSIIKILWFKEKLPSIYEVTYKFTTYQDFILKKLGSDDFFIDESMASRTMAFDLHEKKWSENILSTMKIDECKLSKVVESGVCVGKISKILAEKLGLSPNTLLVAGGHDQTCAALGAGIINGKIALDSHGTAEVISTAIEYSEIDRINMTTMFESYFPCYMHVVKDKLFTFSLNHTAGLAFRWFAENFCITDYNIARAEKKSVYDVILGNMPNDPTGLFVLPHFSGSGTPTCNSNAKAGMFGMTLSTDRFDIAKAMLEALAYETKINLEAFKKAGIGVSFLRCVGGGAKSPCGLQIKADVLGFPVHTLKQREAACLGAGMLAAVSAGIFKTPNEAISVVREDRVYEPDYKKSRVYDELFTNYKLLYETLSKIK